GDVGIGVSNPTHKLDIVGGAYCDGGAWVAGSSREYKENITDLTLNEAMNALENLAPVKFNYKINKEEEYMGFIAEDVPELVATNERNGVAPMDVIAVLTKVVQQQQKAITKLEKKIEELDNR
ncbi:MAG: tail fiber domain-containing protein, partial [Candidatus Aminicenantes bacterium]|nr:tail fiber domain-containing protein [Candidatus Aminicenantes bacterium]